MQGQNPADSKERILKVKDKLAEILLNAINNPGGIDNLIINLDDPSLGLSDVDKMHAVNILNAMMNKVLTNAIKASDVPPEHVVKDFTDIDDSIDSLARVEAEDCAELVSNYMFGRSPNNQNEFVITGGFFRYFNQELVEYSQNDIEKEIEIATKRSLDKSVVVKNAKSEPEKRNPHSTSELLRDSIPYSASLSELYNEYAKQSKERGEEKEALEGSVYHTLVKDKSFIKETQNLTLDEFEKAAKKRAQGIAEVMNSGNRRVIITENVDMSGAKKFVLEHSAKELEKLKKNMKSFKEKREKAAKKSVHKAISDKLTSSSITYPLYMAFMCTAGPFTKIAEFAGNSQHGKQLVKAREFLLAETEKQMKVNEGRTLKALAAGLSGEKGENRQIESIVKADALAINQEIRLRGDTKASVESLRTAKMTIAYGATELESDHHGHGGERTVGLTDTETGHMMVVLPEFDGVSTEREIEEFIKTSAHETMHAFAGAGGLDDLDKNNLYETGLKNPSEVVDVMEKELKQCGLVDDGGNFASPIPRSVLAHLSYHANEKDSPEKQWLSVAVEFAYYVESNKDKIALKACIMEAQKNDLPLSSITNEQVEDKKKEIDEMPVHKKVREFMSQVCQKKVAEAASKGIPQIEMSREKDNTKPSVFSIPAFAPPSTPRTSASTSKSKKPTMVK